jgi:hypothetical protein
MNTIDKLVEEGLNGIDLIANLVIALPLALALMPLLIPVLIIGMLSKLVKQVLIID